MKIIHTADIHLDSPLVGVSDSNSRRSELLRALSNMAQYAQNQNVAAIIVAGDLFDEKFVAQSTVKYVAETINSSSAEWFVLRGNHGSIAPYDKLKELCPKVNYFGEDWQSYVLGNVCIIGRELGANDQQKWDEFSVNPSLYNVLVLHGDVDSADYGLIDKKAIAASKVNYVALGHRHAFCMHKFGTVKGCYSGVLEPRGFDEDSETGFVVIDTDTDKVSFQKQHVRTIETATLDVSNITNDLALENAILGAVAAADGRNYLNLKFVGTLAEDVRLIPVAKEVLQGKFFALRLQNDTTVKLDYEQLKQEVSLRGEFVKLACEISDEKLREEVLCLGLKALDGEV